MNKQFKEWYRDVFSKEHDIHEDAKSVEMMPWPFRWGVYLEFFDSVGIHLDCHAFKNVNYKICYGYQIRYADKGDELHQSNWDWTRTEAQQEAIKKAFEILK
jgi:hypothetical protein